MHVLGVQLCGRLSKLSRFRLGWGMPSSGDKGTTSLSYLTRTCNKKRWWSLSRSFNICIEDRRKFCVLIVHRGSGAGSPNLNSTLDFIQERYSEVKYLLSVCTGALLLLRYRLLDGHSVTTHKAAYESAFEDNHKVDGIPHTRLITDENIWATSGVPAAVEGMLALSQCLHGIIWPPVSSIKSSSMMAETRVTC